MSGTLLSRRTTRSSTGVLLLEAFLVLFAIVQMFPLIWLVLTSFKDNVEITGQNVIGLPRNWRLVNYTYVLTATRLARNFLNSLFYTVAAVVLSGILSAMASYAIARMTWRLNKLVLALFMTGLMIPVHATLLPVFLMLRTVHLFNTPLALIIPYTTSALPTTIFIMTGFFQTIPRELEEAAVIDGCSIYTVFARIVLPLTKPALVTTAVFTFLAAWNELMFANTLINNDSLATVTVAVNSLRGVHFTEYGAIFAGLTLATLAPIVVYIIMSDRIQRSIVAGAIKG